MAWKKQKTRNGICYSVEKHEYKYIDIIDISIEDLNDPSRDIDLTKNPKYGTERFDVMCDTKLPVGIYSLKSESVFDDPMLFPIELSSDKEIFTLDVNKEVIKDFKDFIKARPIYERVKLIHKRGALLYGPPGTGKTVAINHIINKVAPKDSVVIYVTCQIPTVLIKELREDARLKIFVFEELTLAITGGNLARFLTFLDGENSLNNCYVLATTNYPESLPAELMDRPGRFDTKRELSFLGDKDRTIYLEYLLNRKIKKGEIEATANLSIAYIKEIALRVLTRDISIAQARQELDIDKEKVYSSFQVTNELGFADDND